MNTVLCIAACYNAGSERFYALPSLSTNCGIRIAERGEIVHYSWLKLNKGRKTQVLKTLFLVIKPEQKFNSKALFEIIDRE